MITNCKCRLVTAIILLLTANTITAQKPVVKKAVSVAKKPTSNAVAPAEKIFDNGITLKIKGFSVAKAYLIYNDETLVPAANKIALNEQVNVRIVLEKGFKEEDGKVFPGGTETIVLSTGEKILESDDLFAAYDITGVNPADAKYLTFKAVITEMRDKTKFITVSFRVWDKKSKANEITGSYKLYIK